MKILLVNVNYGVGSTGKITKSLFESYKKMGHDVYCLYGRKTTLTNDKYVLKKTYELESKIHHFFSLFTENIYGGMFFSTNRIIRFIKKNNPDIVNLHCLNGYFVNIYRLINFLKKKGIKTVLTNHAEFVYTANCPHSFECKKWINEQCRKCEKVKEFNGKHSFNRTHQNFDKMRRAFLNFDKLAVTNVSPWLTVRSSQSPLFSDSLFNETVLNPVPTAFFKSIWTDNPYKKYSVPNGNKIVFFCTPYFQNKYKGGDHLLNLAALCKRNNITFFVKSGTNYRPPSYPKNVIFIEDNLSQDELADFYHFADCSLILSKAETFSMVVAESLACGTPVVGFYAGGPETIVVPGYGIFGNYGDMDLLKTNLLKTLSANFSKEKIQSLAFDKYNEDKISRDYFRLYSRLVK